MAQRGLVTTNRVFALTLVTLCITSFLPRKMLTWTHEPGQVIQRLTSPPAHAVKYVTDRFGNPEYATNPDTTIGQIDTLRGQNLALQIEIQRLKQEVAQLSGVRRAEDQSIIRIPANVIAESTSASSRVFRIRAGTRDGVRPGSVASTRDTHLLGRVTNITATTCEVIPITDQNSGTIEGSTVNPDGTPGIRFDLTPQDDSSGTLKGPGRFETVGLTQTPLLAEVGQQVSLTDENWPLHTGLIIGEIIAVEQSEQSPQRQVITVKPHINTRMVSSVFIRVPEGTE